VWDLLFRFMLHNVKFYVWYVSFFKYKFHLFYVELIVIQRLSGCCHVDHLDLKRGEIVMELAI